MLNFLKRVFLNSKNTLFTFNDEPFSKFSIFFIILLDIFLLTTIFNGISSEKNMAPKVYTKYPSQCQNHFDPTHKKKVWDNTSARYIYTEDHFPFKTYNSFNVRYDNAYYSSKRVRVKDNMRVSQMCRDLDVKIAAFANTREFKNNKKLLTKLKNDKRNVFSDINNIERRYNTKLFEKTANESSPEAGKSKIKYYSLLNQEKLIDKQIKAIKPVDKYKGYDEYVLFIKEKREAFKKEIDSYRFWQPFVSFLYLLKFTLPLLLLSFLGYRYANRINRKRSVPIKLLSLVSGHIIFISAIPIFFNGIYLLYHIIPHRFFETIIGFLYAFGFIFLGYYFLMFVGILVFGFLIFFIQRNASRREQLKKELKEKTHYIRAFSQNKCPNCQNRVGYETQKHCGYCSEELVRSCGNCGEDTPKYLQYCIYCGNTQI